jgi:predicted nucleic acid-binding protein
MPTFLLDTNVIINEIKGRRDRSELLDTLIGQGILLACTSINVCEMYMGMRPHEADTTERFLRSLEFFPVTWEIARHAGTLYSQWRAKGQTLSLADVTIAAVCLTHKLTLVTDNDKHFPMAELIRYPLPPV